MFMQEERNFARDNVEEQNFAPTQIGPPAEDSGPIRDTFTNSQSPGNIDAAYGQPSRAQGQNSIIGGMSNASNIQVRT